MNKDVTIGNRKPEKFIFFVSIQLHPNSPWVLWVSLIQTSFTFSDLDAASLWFWSWLTFSIAKSLPITSHLFSNFLCSSNGSDGSKDRGVINDILAAREAFILCKWYQWYSSGKEGPFPFSANLGTSVQQKRNAHLKRRLNTCTVYTYIHCTLHRKHKCYLTVHTVKSVQLLETYVDPAADKYLLETADKAYADAQWSHRRVFSKKNWKLSLHFFWTV